MSGQGEYGDVMGDCELCGATKVSLREHRVNKAMLAICPKCVNQLNLGPKEEAPGLARARRNPTVNSKPRSFRKNNIMNKACLLYTSPSPRDATLSRMPSSA